jgi:polyribonucleotide nucleotidyltransferase
MKIIEKRITLADGREIIIETGKLAKQADGSVVVKMGRTMLLATVVSAKEAKEDVDFMPLSVEYQEKFAAIGRFPGGFQRREGKSGDREILVSRLIDRALRPLFPDDFHAETFVTVHLVSADSTDMPDALAGLAASAALAVSDIPFNGPISEVRVSRIDGQLVINPSAADNERADLELMVGATQEHILMVEGEMSEVSEAEMIEAIKFAHDAIKIQCAAQLELTEAVGKTVKREYNFENQDEELRKYVTDFAYNRIYDIAKAALPKHERGDGFEKVKEELIASLPVIEDKDEAKKRKTMLDRYYHDVEKKAVRNLILDENIRLDGRKTDQIRPIWCEVDYLPAAHGSAVFTRGETQSLTSVTLGSKMDEKIVDEVMFQGKDKFLLHYNFPPFATGEARPSRGVSRREVGHGNLAHRALKRMIPGAPENPYTIRVVSDILESNGSSSMATVCAGTLALMDSGIKLRKPVSGIAMGLITDMNTGKFAVLSDILGDEDHLGDMDFKVAGTKDGITATQMDIKVGGLTYEILEKALAQANKGRMHILGILTDCLAEPRSDYKPHAPRIENMVIPREMIGAVIGQGGKVIQQIQFETKTDISLEEIDGKGHINIAATDAEGLRAAMRWISSIVELPEVGKVYEGKVKSLQTFGAFVEILPGKEGLLHISEIDWKRLEKVEDALKEGDVVEVKLIEVDEKTGKLRLSRKALLPKPEGFVEHKREHSDRPYGDRGDRGGYRRDDRGGRRDDRRDDRGDRPQYRRDDRDQSRQPREEREQRPHHDEPRNIE